MKCLSFLLFSSVLICVAVDASPNILNFLKNSYNATVSKITSAVGQAVENFGESIQNAKQEVGEALISMASSQCSRLQEIFGVSFEQYQGEKEPSMDNLTLYYKTQSFTKILNMSIAADTLREARSFDSGGRLIMFVHGYTDDPTKESFVEMCDAFFKIGHISLFALDASPFIRKMYLRSATLARFVAKELAKVLVAAVERGQDPALIHIIGHSLGAQISGFTGKIFQELTGKMIGRITALDPAGPCFSHVHSDLRLKNTDAAYVDAMHTNAGFYGLDELVGHKDYYPNCGSVQPNCNGDQGCAHQRTVYLYVESILNPRAFPAVVCKDWSAFQKGECDSKISYMGFSSTREEGEDGIYFLQTGGTSPFGLGMDGITYKK